MIPIDMNIKTISVPAKLIKLCDAFLRNSFATDAIIINRIIKKIIVLIFMFISPYPFHIINASCQIQYESTQSYKWIKKY